MYSLQGRCVQKGYHRLRMPAHRSRQIRATKHRDVSIRPLPDAFYLVVMPGDVADGVCPNLCGAVS